MYKTFNSLSIETICNLINEVFDTSLNQSKIFSLVEYPSSNKKNERVYFNTLTKKLTLLEDNNTVKILEISYPFVNNDIDKIKFHEVWKRGIMLKYPVYNNKFVIEYLVWYDTVLNTTQRIEFIRGLKKLLIDMKGKKYETM